MKKVKAEELECQPSCPYKGEVPENIMKSKPKIKAAEFSLQEYKGYNMVQWYYRTSGVWEPAGPIFVIKK